MANGNPPYSRNKTRYKTLDKIANDPRVEYIEEDEDGIWIYLKSGYNFEGCSAVREDTVGQALESFARVEKGDPY